MDIIKTPILEGITPEEQEQMRVCFGVREEAFRAGEAIYDFSEGRKYLGLIAHGSAVLQRIDRQGGRAILEHLESGGVFGEMLMFENVAGDSITVIAEEPCRVWFMQDEHMTRRCERACGKSCCAISACWRASGSGRASSCPSPSAPWRTISPPTAVL